MTDTRVTPCPHCIGRGCDECNETGAVSQESLAYRQWKAKHGSHGWAWCWPHFDRMKPADKRPRVVLNRYPDTIIGLGVVLFGQGWGIRWKESWSSSRARRRVLRGHRG